MEHFDWLHGLGIPLFNFAIFVGVLVYFGRKPLAAIAQTRRAEYEALYAAAREAQLKAEEQLNLLNKRRSQLDAELAEIKQRAKAEADAEAQRIIQRGQELAAHIRSEAERIAAGEVLRAKEALRAEVLASVREEVSKKLLSDFGPAEQLRYARDNAAQLKQIITRA